MFWIPPRKQNQYDPVFANNTWAKIIKACQNKEVPETWTVGSQKAMTINGTDFVIDIIGKEHDDYADGSGKAPLTFQLHDCYGETKNMNSSNTNSGGWTSCAMRSTHLPAILARMPTEVQNGIREVNKLTSAGSQSATINTTADKLFLLSEIEIFGSVRYSKSGEGTQYDCSLSGTIWRRTAAYRPGHPVTGPRHTASSSGSRTLTQAAPRRAISRRRPERALTSGTATTI